MGYSCLYLRALRPPDCLMTLRRLMSLDLSWGVGSVEYFVGVGVI